MKKRYIKLFEEFISEQEDETGMKSVNSAMGMKMDRFVVSGEGNLVELNKEAITNIFLKYDKDSKVEFYEKTGKIVAIAPKVKFDSYKKDLKTLDKGLSIEKKKQTLTTKKENKYQDNNLDDVVLQAIENIEKWLGFKLSDLQMLDFNSAVGVIAGFLESNIEDAVNGATNRKIVMNNLEEVAKQIMIEIQNI